MDRPGGDHEQVLRIWQGRPGKFVAHACLMAAIMSGMRTMEPADSASLVLVWAISITCAAYAVCYYLIDWYFGLLLRRLRRLAAPPSEAPVWRPPERPDIGSALPPEICFRRPVVTPDAPVAPRSPLNIAYFRCFANAARTRSFLEGAWTEFGHVHLLRDPNSTTWRERWRSRSPEKTTELIVSTEDQLLERLQHASTECLVREFLCGDAFWQQAAYRLIVMADLVVIDLSGLTPESSGLQFELEQAFATKRSDQVVVLADDRSDLDYLSGLVRRAWTGGPAVVNAYIIDRVVSRWAPAASMWFPSEVHGDRKVELHSSRAEVRRLLRAILASQDS